LTEYPYYASTICNAHLAQLAQFCIGKLTLIELIHTRSCLVFGCGNPLFGDDGFGPLVIEHLDKHHSIPEHAACMDAGTAVRDLLFDILLSEKKPGQIIIIDSSRQKGKVPGEISEIDIDQINPEKTCDFSLHQFPTTNMLRELKACTDVDVRVLVVQPEHIPEEIQPGISPCVAGAVPEMCKLVMEIIKKDRS
jgi:coenzyme F420 hydrogenase subunit delta